MSSSHSNSTFDPFDQVITLQTPNGESIPLPLPILQEFIDYQTKTVINYGSQLGASLIVLIILLLLTRPEKRTTIFVLNSLALCINFIRYVIACCYFTGPWSNVYAYFTGDYSRVRPTDYAQSVTSEVLPLFVLLCIEASLTLQTRVITKTMKSLYGSVLLLTSVLVALVAIGFRFGMVVTNCEAILNTEAYIEYQWLLSATNITTTISICYFSAIFGTKLGYTIWERRRLGLRQFGPMQILFVTSCQTLFIPAIFSILQYPLPNVPVIYTNVLTLTCIFLPLSTLWAASHTSTSSSAPPNFRPRLKGIRLLPSSFSASSSFSAKRHLLFGSWMNNSNKSNSRSTWGGSGGGSNLTSTTTAVDTTEMGERERDMGILEEGGIRVNKSYSVAR
ncbi:MAG: hypothetical protein M1834_002246 [Cirrosporium novae-zelandiae]|nr:MAG: hypothetical protein M1834_002246 [Cirrosporium novae-zelandiae]